ncbi:MAG TPA: PDZ domain-containing protein [Anaerolineaceae bacterium]
MKKVTMVSILLISVLLASACSPLGISIPSLNVEQKAPAASLAPVAQPTPVSVESASPGAVAALQGTLAQIYTRVNPSVVNIQVTTRASAVTQPSSSGVGSGFVWDKAGHIVTNNHVIDGASQITVNFSDGTSAPAKLIGADASSDLAVIKVDVPASKLLPVQVADSNQVKVGQLAIAIGTPFGLEGTMTVGIISAVGRSMPADLEGTGTSRYSIPDVIQTDAAINPGNSGGVLVNDYGQVIGVTFAIESPSRSNAGVGFAIPSAIVQKVVPGLIQNGKYEYPWLGISGSDITATIRQEQKLDDNQRGVLVGEVTNGSPAEKGGVKANDIIISVDRKAVTRFNDLISYLVGNTQVGQKIELTVLRSGKEITLTITLAARPAETAITPANQQQPPTPRSQIPGQTSVYIGISVVTLTPSLASALQLPENTTGVLIIAVQPGSPAEKAGLQAATRSGRSYTNGDVITAVDGKAVDSNQSLQAAYAGKRAGDEITLSVLRGGKTVEVKITLAARQ